MPDNSHHEIFKTKPSPERGADIAAVAAFVIYIIVMLFLFGAKLKQDSFLNRAGAPVDAVEIHKSLTVKQWGELA